MPKKHVTKIAVIGAGAAGLTAAYLLGNEGDEYRVTLYERQEHLGGDVHTVVVPEGPDSLLSVDTGFTVFNDRDYPSFKRLLEKLGVRTQKAEMSFSYFNLNDHVFYSTKSIGGKFAQEGSLFKPAFYKFLSEVRRFGHKLEADFKEHKLEGLTLGDYLAQFSFSKDLTDHYLLPLRALVWTLPEQGAMTDCPAESFARFLLHYGVIEEDQKRDWLSIPGGGHGYVNAILKRFKGEVRKKTEIQSVRRTDEKVLVKERYGFESLFDYVVIATHADEALGLLEDATTEEKRLLSPWRYTKCSAILHTDDSLMPPRRAAWASWNMRCGRAGHDSDPGSLTCHMNRLQRLKTNHEYFVTLNGSRLVARDKVIKEVEFRHPIFSFECLRLQRELQKINDSNGRTFFCGSYFGAGFHENALRSMVDGLRSFCLSL